MWCCVLVDVVVMWCVRVMCLLLVWVMKCDSGVSVVYLNVVDFVIVGLLFDVLMMMLKWLVYVLVVFVVVFGVLVCLWMNMRLLMWVLVVSVCMVVSGIV